MMNPPLDDTQAIVSCSRYTEEQLDIFRKGLLAMIASRKKFLKHDNDMLDMVMMLHMALLTDSGKGPSLSVTSIADILNRPRQSVKNRVEKLIWSGRLKRLPDKTITCVPSEVGNADEMINLLLKTADQIRAASSTDQSTYSLPLSA